MRCKLWIKQKMGLPSASCFGFWTGKTGVLQGEIHLHMTSCPMYALINFLIASIALATILYWGMQGRGPDLTYTFTGVGPLRNPTSVETPSPIVKGADPANLGVGVSGNLKSSWLDFVYQGHVGLILQESTQW